MDIKLAVTIIFVVIEVMSFVTKKWFNGFVKYLPLMNTVIGVIGSLILKTDILAGLATAGISCAGYDAVKGIMEAIKERNE